MSSDKGQKPGEQAERGQDMETNVGGGSDSRPDVPVPLSTDENQDKQYTPTGTQDQERGLNGQSDNPTVIDGSVGPVTMEADQASSNNSNNNAESVSQPTNVEKQGSDPEKMDTEPKIPPGDTSLNKELPPLEHVPSSSPDQADAATDTVAAASSGDVQQEVPPQKQSPGGEAPPLEQTGACEASASTSDSKEECSGQSVYYIKWIQFKQTKVPIITQNENGPCPLLAIMNVLLLRGKVKLAPMLEMVTSEQLMTYLGESILDSMPENLSETVRANYEQNMQDAMSVMYKLQTGLDVNVRFTGVGDFEYTPECIIFDLLSIPLYHGWLVDPQDPVCTSAVALCSYNQLVEKIIAQKSSDKEEAITEALVAEQFLDRTASQLTYYGLCELSTSVREDELCVFFRNNHFTTLFRTDNELFLLVTDQGFLTEPSVVWETLSNVEGDCHFVDGNFRTYTKPEPSAAAIAASNVAVGSDQQIDQDYQVALSLQQEAEMRDEQESSWGTFQQETCALQQADAELARRLQEEEDRRAAAAVNASQQRAAQPQGQGQGGQGQGGHGQGGQGHPQAAHSSSSGRQGRGREREKEKEKDCTIL